MGQGRPKPSEPRYVDEDPHIQTVSDNDDDDGDDDDDCGDRTGDRGQDRLADLSNGHHQHHARAFQPPAQVQHHLIELVAL